jgi:uncharacterized protein YcnI
MKTKFVSFLTFVLSAAFLLSPLASAHVLVSPSTAAPAERVTFSVSVPNEKEVPVTELRLTVPAGLAEVTPTVHTGWTIETAESGGTVTSITWKGGEIPAGQRDDFSFRAQTPKDSGELQWKAYQTYSDGSVVSWDHTPSNKDSESETAGPYSVTTVAEPATAASDTKAAGNNSWLPLAISLVALILSLVALLRSKTSKTAATPVDKS